MGKRKGTLGGLGPLGADPWRAKAEMLKIELRNM
jgi:hypothetical protein